MAQQQKSQCDVATPIRTRQRSRALDLEARRTVQRHFEEAPEHSQLQQCLRNYYRYDVHEFVREWVPEGARVLDLGCGDGILLASLKPSFGVGIDISPQLIERAKRKYPALNWVCGDIEQLPVNGQFDYVIVSNSVGFLLDVWTFFRYLPEVAHSSTRFIITYYNFVWEPIIRLAGRLGLKRRDPLQNWLAGADLVNLLELSGFETISSGYRVLVPAGPRRVLKVLNGLLSGAPLLNKLGLSSYAIARSLKQATDRSRSPGCTVVIPTRNERGNIRPAIERLPQLGSHTEVIFVDGNSSDGTADEIQVVIKENPDLDLKLIHQGDGVGKGDAVRKGFAAATQDILMILDADLTVPPEDLPKFWAAIAEGKGEFINGTRLVYPMEKQAMRIANIAGNKFFSGVFTWIVGQRISDTLCGTKVLWRDDYERIAENRSRFGKIDPFGDFDLLFGAAGLGLKILEVPIRYRARTYGSTNIDRWRHGVLLMRMAAKGARALKLR